MRLLIAVLLATAAGMAQMAPVLQTRGAEDGAAAQVRAAKGISTLPETASGEYAMDGHGSDSRGSVVQITVERNRLTGYVTKMEAETALTLFFDRTAINGNRISFTTKTVHGLRYSFTGKIARGDAASATETGFFRMTGEWTAYRNGGRETERVSFKSTPRD